MQYKGQGLSSLETFCSLMCLPSPVSQKAYDRINAKIADVSEALVNALMKKAAAKEKIVHGTPLSEVENFIGKKKFSDEKITGGNGRLTDAFISKLTYFYGNAIRATSQNVNEMMEAVWGVWAYTSSADDETKHWFCPKGKNSCNVSMFQPTTTQ
ncbi:hypothetical protein TNIN_198021 [Trichonephila inaurata madagascariensis]|uniref:Uncharacterized protein n=1 Tax=Trichonephila inaurata madagascariensis TaxID=2747483 RepID=A0A8X6M801_9ARAC|nr:hypothetical protein TNIN_198021 [Trichonephila inaurata madagascariensis]